MKESLFTLLRIGLNIEQPSEKCCSLLSTFGNKEWTSLFLMAEKQAVVALMFDGLQKVCEKYGDVIHAKIKKDTWCYWVINLTSRMLAVERQNEHLSETTQIIAGLWHRGGLRMMVMKGQANAIYYPIPNHRSPGDIDCWLFGDFEKGNELARRSGADVDDHWYKHSVISLNNNLIENHRIFGHTREGKLSKQREQAFVQALHKGELRSTKINNVFYPTVAFNAKFLTYHAFRHFLSEGLRLKQIIDWAMFLQVEQHNIDWEEFYEYCDYYHLRRFADAMTSMAVRYFGVSITVNDVATKSMFAEKIMSSSLYDDDYIFSSGEGGWRNRWHIIKNMLTKDKWKFSDIYQQSVIKQLWYYTTGFLFKTE